MLGTTVNIDDVKKMYGVSALPAAAIGADGAVIYSNDAFGALFRDDGSMPKIIHTGKAYDEYIIFGGREYRMYVTPYGELSVAVFIACGDGMESTLSAAVRHAADGITHCADEIDIMLSSDGSSVPDIDAVRNMLNSIDRSVMTLLSEFLIPEQIRLLRYSRAEDYPTVSISESAEQLAAALGAVLVSQPLGIITNVAAGMFARIDVKSLRLIMTDYVVSCLENGEYDVDGVGITLTRVGEDKMLLTLSCSIITKRNRRLESSAVPKPLGSTLREELIGLMKQKFGCNIEISEDINCRQIRAEIPRSEDPRSEVIKSPVRVFGSQSRFSDENIMLSRFGVNPRY